MNFIKTLLLSASVIGLASLTPAAASIGLTPSQPAVTQDFNSMWSNGEATLTLPEGWRVDRNLNAPRRVGAWAEASSEVMYSGGVSLASNAKNGTWNFGADTDDRAVGGLTTTVANGTRGISVMTALSNDDADKIITSLDLSYNIEKYRKGANTAGFRVQLYTSADGETWKDAGENFQTLFEPDNETAGAAVVPISTTEVSNRALRTHILPGQSLYLAWNISVASGSTPDKAPGLALDDIAINATFADSDPDWEDPEVPEINHSGIYIRGIDGWDAVEEWEFNKLSETTFELKDKLISGSFKIADASWSSTCNYGSNGTSIIMGEPYTLSLGVDDNISCGGNTYNCSRILLTIENGIATLTLYPNESMEGLTSIYMVGDFNGWNYMNTDGKLQLDDATGTFKGRVSLRAGQDGLSHWMIYQRPGMAGAWGLQNDATDPTPLTGSLIKGATGKIATAPGTYDITVSILPDGTGSYSLTPVEAEASELTVTPEYTILVPQNPAAVRILSLNNSLIHYNDQSAMFNAMAASAGKDAEWVKHTLLGKSLATHWDEGDDLAADGLPGAKMMVRSQPWSHIILQEQSSLPRTDLTTFRNNVERWVNYIREYCPNPNAVIIMPVNWAYSGDWSNFTPFNEIFMANYRAVADEFGIILCPVMQAYQNTFDASGADGLAAWFQDDRHPTDMSTYMAACMEYELIYNEDPRTLTYAPAAVSATNATAMREAAHKAMSEFAQTVNHHTATVKIKAAVKDSFGLELPAQEIKYTLTDDKATVTPEGVFTSTVPGEYTVTVKGAGFEKTAVVKVASAVTEMEILPSISFDNTVTTYAQDFNTLGEAAEAILPEGWRIDRTDSPRAVGSFLTALDHTTYAGGVSLPSNAKNGVWNFGPDADDRAVGGITTGVANGTRAVNVYAHLLNNGSKKYTALQLSYDIEKYRDGNNAAGFNVTLYTSVDGRNWSATPADFTTNFPASAATAGSAEVPIETVTVSSDLPVDFAPGLDLYLAWNISVASGNDCQGAPALAIDNVDIEAIPEPVPAYDWHIYIEDNTGYDALGLYAYGDKEIWGAWPGQAPIDQQTINGVTYKVFGHNEATGKYNIILNNWNRGLQLPDYPIQGGEDYYLRATSTGLSPINSGIEEVAVDMTDDTISYNGTTIECAAADTISIYTLTGMLIRQSNTPAVSVDTLPDGIYVAVASSPRLTATTPFLKH
ncbi:MAG: DUF4886 domain-containing protein [Muribaculaceae bacterium]|nr:DUF4886 domain-containing protein [Muribaculaceae bacterium]